MSFITHKSLWPPFEIKSIRHSFSEARFSCLGWKRVKLDAERMACAVCTPLVFCLRAACMNSRFLCKGTPCCSDSAATCYFRTPSPPTLGVMGFSKAASYELVSAVFSESHSGTFVPWSLTPDAASVWEAFAKPWTMAAAICIISCWCQPKSCWAMQVPHCAGMLSWAQSLVTSQLCRSPGSPAGSSSRPPRLLNQIGPMGFFILIF